MSAYGPENLCRLFYNEMRYINLRFTYFLLTKCEEHKSELHYMYVVKISKYNRPIAESGTYCQQMNIIYDDITHIHSSYSTCIQA